ncbi:peptide chain release factor N(5)-glutamine methyltransferase [Helicobacter didelphidarum]|uniref:peptide chain release factor N(5)-glutamine methyltransferase n=1 Tax=Helicobacter didelphidarum TaxID=2040648 RepID=A0A3D8IJH1_9HELI|nr:peptide chain release factor N(5)-glutamine methyltransferase [Helicobacter didelphidarum]
MEIDLLLRIAVAFLKDMNLEDFQKLVYETSFLVSDINSFENDKIPKDSDNIQKNKYSSNLFSPEFHITSPRYEAEILLGFILNMTRVEIHANPKKEINDFNKQRYFKLLAMRKNGTPLEYLTNRVSFYNLELYVDKNVLIPRPETEILVDKAIELMNQHNIASFVEVGVGSGAIITAILKNTQNTYGIATDISKEALNIAKHNAEVLGVKNRCDFIESNLLDSPYIMLQKPISLLIANPPYIANNYPLNQEVLCEPHIALFGGEKGDEILKRLIMQARQKNITHIICEMGYNQKASMQEILHYTNYEVAFYKDYAGLDRGFVATLCK